LIAIEFYFYNIPEAQKRYLFPNSNLKWW